GAQVPGIKVIGVNGNNVTFTTVSPEIKVDWTGSVFTEFYTFIGKAKDGDIVNDNGVIKRLKEGESGGVSVQY
ncbi:MAG TPA: hypothetical protein VFM18_06530, partial [Methanosarcina sp.]|nr:hypothetical protein [Methanosarcina sp.]